MLQLLDDKIKVILKAKDFNSFKILWHPLMEKAGIGAFITITLLMIF